MAWSQTNVALTGKDYVSRFNTFRSWYQTLPSSSLPEFIEFIKQGTPLSQKLRGKWLYELAKNKDWTSFLTYYQTTSDLNLVCYKQIALFQTGLVEQALKDSYPLWLTGDSLPPSCTHLFDLLLKTGKFDQNLITERLILALAQRNISLAYYLLKQYTHSHAQDLQKLASIYTNPANITPISTSDLTDDFYLYGLKRLVALNMEKAIHFWKQAKSLLSESQQQAFLAHITLYKAMRNHEDTLLWLNKVKPQYYNEILIDWSIRFALKHEDWSHVRQLINASKNKDMPCWQYWLARSLQAQGKKEEAQVIYESLAKNRHYYGFLASLRLNKAPSFEDEKPSADLVIIRPYQTIMDEIESLYKSKKILEASRLLNDFISELPKDEASALVYWVDSKLKWYGKSVYLSNETLNNQLYLRFPLAYNDAIGYFSKQYGLPPEFVYAIIRQESGFRDDVVSTVGARGLMQVMPRTAAVVSKTSKIPYTNPNQLFLPQKNINIGTAYLQQLAKQFKNHPVLMAAAYNAGPRQVVYWLKNHPPKEIDIWIETLPWQETRNYLKNVLAFYVVYQFRLHQKPDIKNFMQIL
ncbi:MAG: transglycosylase SLT domain-containing protein [Legionella sp.]|nr:transglycosylase SLT domain-containing protein [Legionella sp.]